MNRNPFPNFDPHAKRRAVEGLPPLADTAALRHARCRNFDNSSQPQSTSSSSNQTDNRVTATDNANLVNLAGAHFTAAGGRPGEDGNAAGGGGVVNVTTNDPHVADVAIAAIRDLSNRTGTSITEAAVSLAKGSNQIAADVAKSQEQFVATASGQKYVLYALVGMIGVLVLPQIFKGKKT